MAREIPEAVRAVAGLAATVLDEARKLPESLPGLPIRVLGMAMQLSMKLQQHYAGLVARGDELFTGLHGENEPGLATFDDEEPAAAPAKPGFRDSAFDRAGGTAADDLELSDAEASEALAGLDVSFQVEATAEVLEEFAIDEMVDQGTAPEAAATEDADALENALLESDRTALETPVEASPAVDVVGPDGEVATADAAVTEEGIAVPESAAEAARPDVAEPAAEPVEAAEAEAGKPEEAAAAEAATSEGTRAVVDTAGDAEASARAAAAAPLVVHAGEIAVDDAMGSGGPETGTVQQSLSAPATPPVEGYDDYSIAQLRGRLRGFAAPTVQQLLEYEEAGQAREPYLRMLRNRLEKLAGA